MPFIKQLIQYGSLSIVGLEKNTGKTACLNYILQRLPMENIRMAVSSVGIDGESTDQVTQTAKPEILLREGMLFTTSEKHFRQRRLSAEVLAVSDEQTALGRLVTARAVTRGKVLLSGPSSSSALSRWMQELKSRHQVDLCIIDGALSRMSLASPAVSESMILTTGAALTLNAQELIRRTAFAVALIQLPLSTLAPLFPEGDWPHGICVVDKAGEIQPTAMQSAFNSGMVQLDAWKNAQAVFFPGALTDRSLKAILAQGLDHRLEVIVKDFTRIFISPQTHQLFLKAGGQIRVLKRSQLLAVCLNPLAPSGYSLNSEKICNELSGKIQLPVYDIKRNDYSV